MRSIQARESGDHLQADLQTLGLDVADFKFGRRVFQCEIPHPGVGYRKSPSFHDKVADGSGPHAPQCIIADAMVQGPKAVWVRCVSGLGWLPLTDSHHVRICFNHLGEEHTVLGDSGQSDLEFSDGSRKLKGAVKEPEKSQDKGWFRGEVTKPEKSPDKGWFRGAVKEPEKSQDQMNAEAEAKALKGWFRGQAKQPEKSPDK